MMQIKAEILALAIFAALVAGFGGGWAVNGWRLSGDINRLQGVVDTQVQSLSTLKGANDRCTAGVTEVKGAVQAFVDAGDKRAAAAAAAMANAAKAAAANLKAAQDALNRPPAPRGKECETAAAEATAYVKKRKGAP